MTPTWVTDSNGNVYLNDMCRYIKGDLLVPPQAYNPLTVAAAPGPGLFTQSNTVIFEGGEDAVTEIFSIIGSQRGVVADVNNRLTVQIRDTAFRRTLMNRPILFDHVFGSVFQPFFLGESILLEGQQTLEFTFFNNSAGGNAVVAMMLETRKFQASALSNPVNTDQIQLLRQRKTFMNPFWLTSDQAIQIPAGGTATAFFRNTRDYYLILQYIMARTITAGVAGDLQERIAYFIRDAKTGRPLMNQPVTLNMGTGTSQFPFVLPTALMVEPFTNIQIDFFNLVTDQPTEVFWTFFGTGLYVSDQNPWANMDFIEAPEGAVSVGAP